MKKIITYLIVVIIIIVGISLLTSKKGQEGVDLISYSPESARELIVIDTPKAGGSIESPLTITGKARGNWYFEATFPISLVNWDGLIIADGYATAQGEWMTTDFVPFEATLSFTKPFDAGPQSVRGALILQKSNPSDLSENDAAAEMPVVFK